MDMTKYSAIAPPVEAIVETAELEDRAWPIELPIGERSLLIRNLPANFFSRLVFYNLSDGTDRILETMELGDPDGWPVISWSGSPGSVLGPNPSHWELRRAGIRWIAVGRPGTGICVRQEGRKVDHCRQYLEATTRAYNIDKCSVVGRSSGSLWALGCIALCPDLVVNAAVFSGIAPPNDGEDASDWSAGMSPENVEAYGMATGDPEGLLASLIPTAKASQEGDIYALIKEITPGMSDSDVRYFEDVNPRIMLIALAHWYGMKNGPEGRFDDIMAVRGFPVGFRLRDCRDKPIRAIQGNDDKFTPAVPHLESLMIGAHAEPSLFLDMGHMATLAQAVPVAIGLKQQAQELLSRSVS